MPLPAWIAEVFKPVSDVATGIIDAVNAPAEKRGELRLALIEAQVGLAERYLQSEQALAEAQSKVIVAEAQGSSWLQRNWRPMIMCIFAGIVAWNFLVVVLLEWVLKLIWPAMQAPPRLPMPDSLWTLLQIGIGGYILGRSGEKIVGSLVEKGLTFRKDEPGSAS